MGKDMLEESDDVDVKLEYTKDCKSYVQNENENVIKMKLGCTDKLMQWPENRRRLQAPTPAEPQVDEKCQNYLNEFLESRKKKESRAMNYIDQIKNANCTS